jgi:hypothetical protein
MPHNNILNIEINTFDKASTGSMMTKRQKRDLVQNFIKRQQDAIRLRDMSFENQNDRQQTFAEKSHNWQVRSYNNNTRLMINNPDLSEGAKKRERMVEYWQNNVIPNHLPPID